MNRRLFVAIATVAATLAAPLAAGADTLLSQPPTANWFGIFGCALGGGSRNVDAGQPFALRLGGQVEGTRGLVRSYIPKDRSTLTVERPLGAAPTASPFQWQEPYLLTDESLGPLIGQWASERWSDVFTLALGERMKLNLVWVLGLPARDLVPPSSTWDPTSAGYPPYDGTGLKLDGGLGQPGTVFAPASCTITGT